MPARTQESKLKTKPKKPSPTFPLTPHPNGQWCKKIRRNVRFFGAWADPPAALDRFLAVAADLHAGREPTAKRGGLTIKSLRRTHILRQSVAPIERRRIDRSYADRRARRLGGAVRAGARPAFTAMRRHGHGSHLGERAHL